MKLKLKFIDIDLDTIKDSENLKALTTEDQIINGQVTFSTAPRVSIIPEEPNENNLVTRSQVNNIVEEIEQATTSYIRWVITDGEVTLLEETVVYVADEWNHRIQKFDLSGNFIRKFDLSFNSGTWQPKDVSLDGFGNIYVTVTADNCIYKYDHEGNFLFRIGYDVLYGYILGVAIDNSGNIYASYYYDDRILKFDSSGNLLFELGGEGDGDGELSRPYGIAVDGSGNLYVAEGWNNRIQKFDPSGNFMMKFGTYGKGEGEFKFPSDVAIDNSGNIYVTDRDNRRVQKFDPYGNFLLDWGAYCENWEDEFGAPQGIAVDHLGNVYVTDRKNNNVHNVQKYDSNGTLLLKWGSRGQEDGQFYEPLGIACFPRPF